MKITLEPILLCTLLSLAGHFQNFFRIECNLPVFLLMDFGCKAYKKTVVLVSLYEFMQCIFNKHSSLSFVGLGPSII